MDALAALLFQMFYQAPTVSDNSSTTMMAVSADVPPPAVITSSPAVTDSNDGSQGAEVPTTLSPSIVQVQPVIASPLAGATNEGQTPAPPSTCDECLPTNENNSTTVTITSNP